jgi:transmembrane sensor
MAQDDDVIPDPVLETATSWAFRLKDAPDDAGVRAALSAWIAESEVHARAWELTRRAWQLTGQATPAFSHEWPPRQGAGTESASVVPLRPTAPPRRHSRVRAAALALAASLLLVLSWPAIQLRLTADHLTSVGEARQVSLEDGSTVTLAADSAIAVAFGPGGRDITLLKGEVFFDVVPNRDRPFSVRAGDLSATVTGTSFDVGLTDNNFSVAVASGSVRVVRAGAPADQSVDLAAGEGVTVERAAGRPVKTNVPVDSVAAWRAGRLIAENVLLTDVVSTIGRYHAGSILVASAGMRGKRVTGVYDLRDPVGALRILAAPYGGTVHEITPYLLVLTAD